MGNQQVENFRDALETADVDAFSGSRTTISVDVDVGDNASAGDVLAKLDTGGSSTVSVNLDVTSGPISIRYDTSPDDQTYFENVRTTDGSVDGALVDIDALRDELQTGSRYVRVVLTETATGTASATIAVEASG